MTETSVRAGGGRMHMPRSRGALSGFLLILLGAWGALIPFLGPLFDFAFTPDREWAWTTGRGWLEVLPGAATVVGGFLLLVSRNRFTAMLGGWLTVLAGAWFVVGRALAGPLGLGDAGTPVASTETKAVALDLAYFYGLGALIIFLGAMALGRLSVRSVRDVRYAERSRAAMTPFEPAPSDEVTEVHPVGGHANTPGGSRTDDPVESRMNTPTNAAADAPADGRREGVEPVRERRRFGGLFGRRDRLAHH